MMEESKLSLFYFRVRRLIKRHALMQVIGMLFLQGISAGLYILYYGVGIGIKTLRIKKIRHWCVPDISYTDGNLCNSKSTVIDE